MSVDDLNRLARKIDAGVEELIGEYLAKNGVPQSVQAVSHMAEDLFPEVSRYRRKMYRQQVIEMGQAAAAHGVEVNPAKLDSYDVNALYTALSDAVGLTPKSRAFVQVEFLDEETQKSVRRKVLIRKADAFDPVVVDEVTKRLGARVGRHIRSGARKAVSNTAMVGQAREARTRKPVKMGYARVLSGSENCSFCAMLASRGPVYSEDTVTRRRDGRKYHDHCDCQGVLVFHGYGWEGEESYKRLEAEWMAADEGDGSAATLKRFAKRVRGDRMLSSYSEQLPGIGAVRAPLNQDGTYMLKAPYFDDEYLPNLSDTVKHSIWGWRSQEGSLTGDHRRNGHTYDSMREKGSFFPKQWSDLDIANAIVKTVEAPDYVASANVRRTVYRDIDGVMMKVQWNKLPSGQLKIDTAYPIFGAGVEWYSPAQERRIARVEDVENELKKARKI